MFKWPEGINESRQLRNTCICRLIRTLLSSQSTSLILMTLRTFGLCYSKIFILFSAYMLRFSSQYVIYRLPIIFGYVAPKYLLLFSACFYKAKTHDPIFMHVRICYYLYFVRYSYWAQTKWKDNTLASLSFLGFLSKCNMIVFIVDCIIWCHLLFVG